jgi:hypothetical protein
MGTRCTTHFIETDTATGKAETCAIVYRHWEGYPKTAGVDLCKFITKCKRIKDSRLSNPSYLAARYVVYLGEIFASDGMWKDPTGKLHTSSVNRKDPNETRDHVNVPRKDRLNFISVGVMMSDPWDIEYRYTVDCGKIDPKTKRPEVKCYKVNIGDDGKDKTRVEVAIPGFTKAAPASEPKLINLFVIPSESKAGVNYTIAQDYETLSWKCSCPAFKYRGGHCKHIAALPFQRRYQTA